MSYVRSFRVVTIFVCLPAFALLFGRQTAHAKCKGKDSGTWYVNAGAETPDQAEQANAFLPNQIWICQGDSIQWTFVPKNEVHTVTFLSQSGQPTADGSVLDVSTMPPTHEGADLPPAFTSPPNFTDTLIYTPPTLFEAPRPQATPPVGPPTGGCPGVTPDSPVPAVSGSPTTCVTSAPSSGGTTYTVTFPSSGNYKLVCLVHTNMNGVIHVLSNGSTLPYDQYDYDRQARDQARNLLEDSDGPQQGHQDVGDPANKVKMTGELTATGGGRHYLAIVRFFPGTIHVHKGDTVEWINTDPTEPHTVTFGTELCGGNCPTVPFNVSMDADGALNGTITSTTDSLTSGFLQAAPEDAVGRDQSPPGTTSIRITFPHEGTFNYFCALHDVDGMVGEVVVEGRRDGDDDRDDH